MQKEEQIDRHRKLWRCYGEKLFIKRRTRKKWQQRSYLENFFKI
jgi:hypothetical protein